MDLEAAARAQRRRRALEALEFERSREAALRDQLEEVAAELEGPRLDADALSLLPPEDAELVREALAGIDEQGLDLGGEAAPDWLPEEEAPDPVAEREERLAELRRLEAEIAASRRRQQALQRYLAALGRAPDPGGGEG